jgi:hypothetical protein
MDICKVTVDRFEIERSHGVSTTIIAVPFGMIYGLLISGKIPRVFERDVHGVRKNHLYSFLVGNWNYGRFYQIFRYLLINGAFILVLLLGFTILLPLATDNFYGQFFLSLFGYLVMGLSMSCFIPLLLIKWNCLDFVYLEPVAMPESSVRLNRLQQF